MDTNANVTPGAVAAHPEAGPLTLALRWTAAYLALSAVALGVGGHGWLVAIHFALLGALAWSSVTPTATADLVRAAVPFVVAGAVAYGEVPAIVAALGHGYHDGVVQGWELSLFGTQPARTLAGALPFMPLSELLHGGYMAFYLATFVPPALLFLRGERTGFAETALTFTVTWLLLCVCFDVFPVQGPRYLWASPPGVPDGPLRRMSMAILSAGSARGAAFPSLHMAASVSQTVMAWRWQPRPISILITAVTVLVGVGAVYAGYHYATDMLVGGVAGLALSLCVVAWSARKAAGRVS